MLCINNAIAISDVAENSRNLMKKSKKFLKKSIFHPFFLSAFYNKCLSLTLSTLVVSLTDINDGLDQLRNILNILKVKDKKYDSYYFYRQLSRIPKPKYISLGTGILNVFVIFKILKFLSLKENYLQLSSSPTQTLNNHLKKFLYLRLFL